MITRRSVVKGAIGLPILYYGSKGQLLLAGSGRRFGGANFYDDDLGVASGWPAADGFILWTRVPVGARRDVLDMNVTWEVATSADMAAGSIIAQGTVATSTARDYTVKAVVNGLEPDSVYYYRFRLDSGWQSVVGRASTLPAADADNTRLSFAVVSCQKFSEGYYTALQALSNEDVRFCIHLGDHIYETDSGNVRPEGDPLNGEAPKNLDQYRSKYRYYLSDSAYREARRKFTWIDLWDDHEVFNNYSGDELRDDNPELMAAAYQAFQEYMPIMDALTRDSQGRPDMPVYRSARFGRLAEFFVLDERQYRSKNPCSRTILTPRCSEADSPDNLMLGRAQMNWLKESLGASQAHWKIMLNEVMMAPLRLRFGLPVVDEVATVIFGHSLGSSGGYYINLDSWDGFPSQRQELYDFIASERINNVVALTGDIHAAFDAKVFRDPDAADGTPLMYELVTSSVTSTSLGERLGGLIGAIGSGLINRSNPHFVWSDIDNHGYSVVDVSKAALDIRHVIVDTVATTAAHAKVAQQFSVPNGFAGL